MWVNLALQTAKKKRSKGTHITKNSNTFPYSITDKIYNSVLSTRLPPENPIIPLPPQCPQSGMKDEPPHRPVTLDGQRLVPTHERVMGIIVLVDGVGPPSKLPPYPL